MTPVELFWWILAAGGGVVTCLLLFYAGAMALMKIADRWL